MQFVPPISKIIPIKRVAFVLWEKSIHAPKKGPTTRLEKLKADSTIE
jgi:hypothetical protein